MRIMGLVCLGLCLVGTTATAALDEAAVDCRAVVQETLAEMELADPQWSESRALLARQAAASACLKLQRHYSEPGSQSLAGSEEDVEEDLGTFLGMRRNKQSGGLHGKPYERRR